MKEKIVHAPSREPLLTSQLCTHSAHALWLKNSVTRLGNILDFGQLFNAFGNN